MVIRRMLVLAAVPLMIGACNAADAGNTQSDGNAQDFAQTTEQQGKPKRERRRIDFAAAAQKLGVTESQLKQALDVPANPPSPPPEGRSPDDRPRRPRMDIPGAAQKLGVTEEQLVEALGIRRRRDGNPSTPSKESQSMSEAIVV